MSLEKFGFWMLRAGSWNAVSRIEEDMTTLTNSLQQVQYSKVQSQLRIAIKRVKVKRVVMKSAVAREMLTVYLSSRR
jgi:hypothetical protein